MLAEELVMGAMSRLTWLGQRPDQSGQSGKAAVGTGRGEDDGGDGRSWRSQLVPSRLARDLGLFRCLVQYRSREHGLLRVDRNLGR